MDDFIRDQLAESSRVKEAVAAQLTPDIAQAARLWVDTLRRGGLIALCGNGGSAADAQHLAGELISRFRRDRASYRGMALTTDTSILTAIGNDFTFDRVYARQVEGLMRAGDLLVALSTSGNAANCVAAVAQARAMNVATMALTGESGGQLGPLVDVCLRVPSSDTPRIQESHITIGHIICDLVEIELTRNALA